VKESGIKIVATNRSAGRDYFLGYHLEAGIALQGSEIKSVRAGQISLKESFIRVESGQAWLLDAHIAPYQPAARQNHDPRRPRRLLLHRRELLRLEQSSRQKGFTLVPTRVYLRDGRAKLEFALGIGAVRQAQVLAERGSAGDAAGARSPRRVTPPSGALAEAGRPVIRPASTACAWRKKRCMPA
jgi:SsrA-binding protein